MGQREDILWKGVLEEVFEDFLRFFYPSQVDKLFDLNRGITFLDKELAQLSPPDVELEGNSYSAKVVDKLVKVYTHSGEEKWVLFHLEIQGTFRDDFAFRMFTYYYRILDRYQRPIAACAILTEPVLKPRTGVYEQEFMGTSIRYQFNVYKIAEQDEAALWVSDNLFALVVLIARSKFAGKNMMNPEERDNALLAFKRKLLKLLESRSISKRKIAALLKFLVHYTRFENEANNRIFNNEIQNNKTMNAEEMTSERMTSDDYFKLYVRLEGQREGKEAGARRLLMLTDFSEEKIAELMEIPIYVVQKIYAALQEEAKEAPHKVNG